MVLRRLETAPLYGTWNYFSSALSHCIILIYAGPGGGFGINLTQ